MSHSSNSSSISINSITGFGNLINEDGDGKTYFIDIDGTIVIHLSNDEIDFIIEKHDNFSEILLPGVKELWKQFKSNDKIIITTARRERHRQMTKKIFHQNNLRYDILLMDLPSGERILINDSPDILFQKAIAVNVQRNVGFCFNNKIKN
jgi:hypothetical protein